MGEIVQIADRLPAWVLLLVAATVAIKYLFAALAEGSAVGAKLLGPIGARMREKAAEREHREDRIAAELQARHDRQLEDLQQRHQVQIADMQSKLDYLAQQVKELRDETRLRDRREAERSRKDYERDDYLIYVAKWGNKIEMWLVEQVGANAKFERMLPFPEWLKDHAREHQSEETDE